MMDRDRETGRMKIRVVNPTRDIGKKVLNCIITSRFLIFRNLAYTSPYPSPFLYLLNMSSHLNSMVVQMNYII